MTNIQVVFLFTSHKRLSSDERDTVKSIVKNACAAHCRTHEAAISVQLYDGAATGNPNDIILAVESDVHLMNEGVLRGNMRDAIADQLSACAFMRSLGFSGKIGFRDGAIRANGPVEAQEEPTRTPDKLDYAQRAQQYQAVDTRYSFDMLKIPKKVLDQIETALGRIRYEREIFEEWGLYAIMPNPVCALSFYGDPGTGKSLAAEAIASKLGKKIIRASYADIENKYVGEGPKNVSAVFLAAEQQDAVLFIDEADSLLSKRMVNVSDPSGQAMNSMRSQLLICLENFHGIVIFATNLAVNYDRAFVSRLISIEFPMPDAATREEIWHAHLYPTPGAKRPIRVPLAEDVDLHALAQAYEFSGRNIRNCIIDACVLTRMKGLPALNQQCLLDAADQIVHMMHDMENARDTTGFSSATAKQRQLVARGIEEHKQTAAPAELSLDEMSEEHR